MARPQSASDDEILDVAEGVLAQLGPDRFSVSEVARQIGLSRAAITFRFDSPENLKQAAIERAAKKMEAKVATWSVRPGVEGLLEIAEGIGAMVTDREGFTSFLLRYAENVEDPDGREMEIKRGEVIRSAIARALSDLPVSKDDAVDAFMAHITGSLMAWRSTVSGDARSFLRKRTLVWCQLVGIDIIGEEQ